MPSMWTILNVMFVIALVTIASCKGNKEDVEITPSSKETFENKSSSEHPHVSPDGPPDTKAETKKGAVISLGEILGFFSFICIMLYCIGIGWKIFKVIKGTYVAEEPVFLKYK